MSIMSKYGIRVVPVRPKTPEQEREALLGQMRKRVRDGAPASSAKKQLRREVRAEVIASTEELRQFFSWLLSVQQQLKLSNTEFATALGITLRMLYYYKARSGHLPSRKTYKRLCELERLTRIRVTVLRDKLSYIKIQPIHVIIIE